MPDSSQDLPYWQVNVPESKRPEKCPDYLKDMNEKDIRILSTPDSEYKRLSWPEVQDIIDNGRIDEFQRLPSDYRLYKEYSAKLKRENGSVMDYILGERLGWTDQKAKGDPFVEADDIKVRFNDWPYGLDKRISHLCVWTKFELKEEEDSDELEPELKKKLLDFVDNTFVQQVGEENVRWWKNPKKLKTVQAVEHFHVLLFNADEDFLKKVTGGDRIVQDAIGAGGDDKTVGKKMENLKAATTC